MDDQNKNLILATGLSFLVILIWFLLFPPEEPAQPAPESETATAPAATGQPSLAAPATATQAPASAAPDAPRIAIATPRMSGTISLKGGRIDELSLNDYQVSLDPDSDTVQLFSRANAPEAYYAVFGWVPGGGLDFKDVPNPDTLWTAQSQGDLSPENPVRLQWDNGAGLIFNRTYEVDENFLFTVTQSVENASGETIRLAPYSELVRAGEPTDLKGFFIIHEGAVRQNGEEMEELDYKKLRKLDPDSTWGPATDVEPVQQNGWLGFTDHYWMAMLIPQNDQPFDAVLRHEAATDKYRAIARLNALDVADGASGATTIRLFAGAKEWETIRDYQDDGGIYKFIDSIDWGWFSFLTKPIFRALHYLNGLIGNMGWSIIALTLCIKAILFPLAYRSYVSMAKMKELQPKMEELRERAGDDRQKMQQEMMALYKREKVNPASGCLPILMQIPIFFSLYKVIFVTIELRHAPWLGWIRDLSAPDPSSILNLFGLLPFAVPDLGAFNIISLGLLPIILGLSMWLQQKLNPAPTDATQAMIFAWMPWVFMFMLGQFASGLVIYWIANNVITFTQQYFIMRSQGYKPDVFGNIRSGFKRRRGSPDK